MKIRTQHANCDYLTNGKLYEAVHFDGQGAYILDDYGEEKYAKIEDCGHLDGHSWEVIDE